MNKLLIPILSLAVTPALSTYTTLENSKDSNNMIEKDTQTVNINWESKQCHTKAYAQTHRDSDIYTYVYNTGGKDEFLEKFDTVTVNWSGQYKLNKKGYEGVFINKSTDILIQNVIENNNGKTTLYNNRYKNVNWMEADAHVITRWDYKENLAFDFKVEASSYASAINAMYAISDANLKIHNLVFKKVN